MKFVTLLGCVAVLLTIGARHASADVAKPTIQHVFIAQYHVQTPGDELFKLVGNVNAVIVVHVNGEKGTPSPNVFATLKHNDKTKELTLKGPPQLPAPANANPKLVEQSYDDSFTAVIPKEWVIPGLKLSVQIKSPGNAADASVLDQKVFDTLAVGAPTQLTLTMFDVHYFGKDKEGNYPAGWVEGLAARLPVAELQVRRVRGIMFDTLVQMPRGESPAVRSSSPEQYKEKAGLAWDGEQAIALRWIHALKSAAGANKTKRPYYLSIYGVNAGGQGWGFTAVGNGTGPGYLLHENGHALGSLPDLFGKGLNKYPYIGPMKDFPAPADREGKPHVGPTWGFDPVTKEFIPVVQNGAHRLDPMGGGGLNRDGGPGGMYRFFSDFHFSLVRKQLEDSQLRWDKQTGEYRAWDQSTGSYSRVIGKSGAEGFPVEEDIDVISLLFSASLVTPEANIVYPPIGPYKGSRIASFDATSPESRDEAKQAGYDDANCHYSVRVTQGEKVKVYPIKDGLDPKLLPTNPSSFAVFAINLPARDGQVTKVELLDTPNVIGKGIGAAPKVLDIWSGHYQTKTVNSTCPDTTILPE